MLEIDSNISRNQQTQFLAVIDRKHLFTSDLLCIFLKDYMRTCSAHDILKLESEFYRILFYSERFIILTVSNSSCLKLSGI
ncbi:hypothetical protein QQG55_39705 [Brugia pahangi]